MNLTKKYYISGLIASPFFATLIATSKLPVLIAFLMGMLSQVAFTIGGYYLGKRTYNDEQN